MESGGDYLRFRRCKRCGGHAAAIQGSASRPICIDCIDQEGPPVEYICSIAGCGNQPVILAVLDDEGAPTVLMCGSHLKTLEGSVRSYMELPPWLTERNAYITGDGDVVFQIDLGPEDPLRG